MLHAMPKEAIELSLVYSGPDVDDGTMSLQDILPVLQGFSSAYGKLAATEDPSTTHKLRIAGVRPGSAEVALEVWRMLGENADQIQSLGVIGAGAAVATGAAFGIVKKIVGVIQAKKHVKNAPYSERISANNSVIISNSQNVTIEVSLDVYELLKSGLLDKDLVRITSPLREGHIDSAEIAARAPDGAVLREKITVDELPFFQTTSVAVTTTSPTWYTAKLNSLVKSTDGGWLWLNDGTRAYYRYVGPDPASLHALFGTYDGPVLIHAVAHLDENLKIVSMDVQAVERGQGELFSKVEINESKISWPEGEE